MERVHIKPPPDVCAAKMRHLCGDAITPTPNDQIHSQRHANLFVQALTHLFLELLPCSPDLTSRRTFKGKAHPLCVSLFPFQTQQHRETEGLAESLTSPLSGRDQVVSWQKNGTRVLMLQRSKLILEPGLIISARELIMYRVQTAAAVTVI